MTAVLDNRQQKKIVSAIQSVEKETSAEIFAVMAQRSDDYRFVAYSFFSFWIFAVSSLLLLWFLWRGNGSIPSYWGDDGSLLYMVVFAQFLAFLCGVVVIRLMPQFAVWLAPERVTHERAHNNAVKQFLAHGIHRTEKRTGVLVFVSLEERFAEILVDRAIEEKIGRDWLIEKVGTLIGYCQKGEIAEGYVCVIQGIGERLAKDFPPSANDENELEDRLVIL